VLNRVPFVEDYADRPYDAKAVTRFFHATVVVDRVLKRFRTGYIGKVSPVHLFWGSFDLAVTRFSGLTAPLHPGGIPALPDAVTREAYSHEKCPPPGSGREAEGSIFPPSTPTPIPPRQALPMRPLRPMAPILRSVWASLCCPMMPCGVQATRKRPSWRFCKPPTMPPPTSAAGTVRHSNVRWACLAGRGPCERRAREEVRNRRGADR
jgi:hypothetical protein